MNQQITIEVSEQVWLRASILAKRTGQKTQEILKNWLEETVAETKFEDLTDQEILALTELKLDDEQQKNFSRLLKKNREQTITPQEKRSLEILTRFYEDGLLRKSKALKIAVERGLIAPLSD